MNPTDIANIRLMSHQVTETKFNTAKDIVGWMGAMQAQDYAMSKWAVGVRLPDSTDQIIETAIDNGEIIRTHLMRPTWHFVSSDDIHWMLELTAPQIKTSLKSRHRDLELSDAVIKKSNAIIEKALSSGKHLLRDELIARLKKANIATDNDNRASHLFLRAELDGIICSGATRNGKQTYALLQERVPKTKSLTREEALAKLAGKYFASHCPATLQDFIWWSGLSVGDAKLALETAKSSLASETIDSKTYWFTDSFSIHKAVKESTYLLPAYDEFIISYKDRSASIPLEKQAVTISSNGIFNPVIVINGQVIGIWKRAIKKDKVILEVEFFKQPSKPIMNLIEKAAIPFGQFLEKKVEFNTKP